MNIRTPPMDAPNIIATLIADRNCVPGFALPHNKDRYQNLPSPPSSPLDRRQSTPAACDFLECEHSICLSFDQPPKSGHDGFVFGKDPECDVLLADGDDAHFVSRKHFTLGFDEHQRLVLRDTSTTGTIVSYDGYAEEEVRRHFTWIIFPQFDHIKVTIPHTRVSFRIELAKQKPTESAYFANVAEWLASRRMIAQSVPQDVQLSRVPIYLNVRHIGSGGYGEVDEVLDASNGQVYALKSFTCSKKMARKEITIMKSIRHVTSVEHLHPRFLADAYQEHIIDFVYAREDRDSILVMELASFGNLREQMRLTKRESMGVLIQSLAVLNYLHTRNPPIAHRDIKPENILIHSRNPLHIKLADFGLAKEDVRDRSGLKTLRGTRVYFAPEITSGRRYTSAVDIWSLGVVVLESAFGLPINGVNLSFLPPDWQKRIALYALSCKADRLGQFLAFNMLRVMPEMRMTAAGCLKKARRVLGRC